MISQCQSAASRPQSSRGEFGDGIKRHRIAVVSSLTACPETRSRRKARPGRALALRDHQRAAERGVRALERATGVRDTLSPQAQILAAMQEGREAVLERPGMRDWIYAPDVRTP